jgi:hypothetical protein
MGMARHAGMVVRWPFGMALTSWRYLWRVTPLHREDRVVEERPQEPSIPDELVDDRLQRSEDGRGPLFHRRYVVRVADPDLSPEELVQRLAEQPNRAAPVEVAVFRKAVGDEGDMTAGDEYVVRMPGPWDGPVRVVDRTDRSYRFATMAGHLEAGQIEFGALDDDDGCLRFRIESWTTAGNRLSALLYSRVRLIKEMQLHMWTFYCEHAAKLAGGLPADGIWITTERFDRS